MPHAQLECLGDIISVALVRRTVVLLLCDVGSTTAVAGRVVRVMLLLMGAARSRSWPKIMAHIP